MGAQPWTVFAEAIERAGIQPRSGSDPGATS